MTASTKTAPKAATKPKGPSVPKPPGTRPRGRRTARPKGTEAAYSGKIFRSRLEARWALMLDLADVDWDYEPCHYRLTNSLWYLPDFWLPDLEIWLEVKGEPFLDADSMAKVLNAVAGPNPIPSRNRPHDPSQVIIFGGDIHPAPAGSHPVHTMVTNGGDGQAVLSRCRLVPGGFAPASDPFAVRKADGRVAAKRPSAEERHLLLGSWTREGATPPQLHQAYQVAARAKFRDNGEMDLTGMPDAIHNRRGGRWIPSGI
jgi:hypothetical protein